MICVMLVYLSRICRDCRWTLRKDGHFVGIDSRTAWQRRCSLAAVEQDNRRRRLLPRSYPCHWPNETDTSWMGLWKGKHGFRRRCSNPVNPLRRDCRVSLDKRYSNRYCKHCRPLTTTERNRPKERTALTGRGEPYCWWKTGRDLARLPDRSAESLIANGC